jgi:branched-chain amino acid transport system permease protein
MDFGALVFYVVTVGVVFVTYNILTWGLNIQFGYTGIPNFTYMTFWAAGGYLTGVTTVGPSSTQPGVQYILGLSWPWPATLLAGSFAAAFLGVVVGVIALGRLRSDYLAIVTFSLGFVAYDVVGSFRPLFNGFDGISGVVAPFSDILPLDPNGYLVFFLGLSAVIMLALWWAANRIYGSAFGRTLRAIRDDVDVSEALGKDTFRFRLIAMAIGCFYAGVAGGLTVEFISAMNTSAWAATETFIVWAAMLLGGRANNLGSVIGTLLLPVLFVEGTRFIPQIPSYPTLIPGLRVMIIGALLLLILWFRPQGLLPEKRPFYELPIGRGKKAINKVV